MLPWTLTSTTIYLKQNLGEQSLRAWKTLLPTHSYKGPTAPRVSHNTNWKPLLKPTTLDFILFLTATSLSCGIQDLSLWQHSDSSCELSCGILVP